MFLIKNRNNLKYIFSNTVRECGNEEDVASIEESDIHKIVKNYVIEHRKSKTPKEDKSWFISQAPSVQKHQELFSVEND